jgi:hypothetical protein
MRLALAAFLEHGVETRTASNDSFGRVLRTYA